MTDALLKRVTKAIDKLVEFQSEDKDCSLFARQAAYICQSILMFEQYKLESTENADLNKKIKQLLHILKHLAFQDEDHGSNDFKVHKEKKAQMFGRIYRNHMMVLMYLNAEKMEINLTEEVVNVARCTFSNCITTNPMEPLPHRLIVTKREPLELRCRYCGKFQEIDKLVDNLL